MLTTIIVITSIAQVILSLFVFFRSRHNLSNRLFFFIGISTLAWALTNYLTAVLLYSPDLIYIVRSILFFVVLQDAAFYLFARTFPGTSWEHSKKGLVAYGLFTVLATAFTLSPFVFVSVHVSGGVTATKAGPGILVFIAHAAFSIIWAFKALIKKMRQAMFRQKRQFQILLFAAFLTWIIVPITNFGLTPLLKTTFFVKASPIYTLIFAAIIAYAIVAQKLFDIRAAVARAVGYTFSLVLIAAIYGFAFFGVINVIFADKGSQLIRQVLQVLLVIALAVSFQSVKRFFDRLTNRLFYRDAYDPQAFLDELNRALVTNLDLQKLLTDAASVVVANLKADWCVFGVKETGFRGMRIIGTLDKHFRPEDIIEVRQITPHLKSPVVIADNLPPEQQKLKSLLAKNDIAMLARLAPNNRSEEGLGYILLGPKKSGNPYSAADERIIDIVARELLIAVQNALHFEEIQNFNATLQQKVDNATRELRRANERLEKLDETKDDFISMASHQLRTPLTSVKGYLSLILDGDVGRITGAQKKMLEQAFISSQRMVGLISDLLNVSRLKSGKFAIEPTPVNLASVVASEMDQLKQTASAKDLTLAYDLPKDFPTLMLDETKTRQVIMNFIDNAIYYTPSGGRIEVKLATTSHAVEFRVVDNGIGVPQAERPHLFTKFYRAKNAQKARPDGTGLGLFMAKKVIVGEGGAIIFDTEEGKGSTFGFSFPLAKLAVKSAKPLAPPEKAASANGSASTSATTKEPAKELIPR